MKNIYTTYLAKAKHLPDDITKIYISRYLPKSITMKGTDTHLVSLSPNPQILNMYKAGNISFEKLIELFLKQLNPADDVSARFLQANLRRIDASNVCLICYEKDVNQCHRKYAATFFADVVGGTYKGEYEYED